ncbi:MAG: threonine--tRNA ligase [Verrucomicrobia bacterium]|jgi:threonyl-tRNA synthetase|nr:threonine--tRNA ligase [Verrucomicrobiota bacterium]
MAGMTPLEEIRHSCAHVLATAVLRLFPEAKLDIGPPTDNGFYYDIDLDRQITAEDLERIEEEMCKVAKENQRFERFETSREEAEKLIREIGQERYKLGRLADIPKGDPISFYRNGEFVDLCAGTHVNYTKKLKAFKLLSVAGAYHRGDAGNKQLQRIYGTAFPNKAELEEYLERLEEAKKRDHRKLGRELNLFQIDDQVGPGLVLWTAKGAIIRKELQAFIAEELRLQGYAEVFTPHIGKLGLYRTSGHFPYYRDSQFFPIVEGQALSHLADEGCSCSELSNRLNEGDVDGFLLKPMNCPMHIKIFDAEPHSYRDLPVRLAEFGTVYRWEQSGELNGLTRVRGFTQDDAHIFCTQEQVEEEIQGCLDLVRTVFRTLGMTDYRVRIGLRDPDSSKYTGEEVLWDKAEAALRAVAKTLDVPYSEEAGEAAFYGPKIDFVVKDVIGREWQLGTVQVDYNLPERFDLTYVGADNKEHRPVMIHRAPFGSMERFTGVLIEHFGGNFPVWLAPEQVRLLPITDDELAAAETLLAKLKAARIRATIDGHSDKLGAKIRRAEVDRIPYMFVLGKKEVAEDKVTVRSRAEKADEGTRTSAEAVALLLERIGEKALPVA